MATRRTTSSSARPSQLRLLKAELKETTRLLKGERRQVERLKQRINRLEATQDELRFSLERWQDEYRRLEAQAREWLAQIPAPLPARLLRHVPAPLRSLLGR